MSEFAVSAASQEKRPIPQREIAGWESFCFGKLFVICRVTAVPALLDRYRFMICSN